MTMFYLALAAVALSGIAILALCLGDPKRRRAAGDNGGMVPRQRQLLAMLSCLPGLGCALVGDSAAFLMWLGGCALIGWTLATCFRGSDMSGETRMKPTADDPNS